MGFCGNFKFICVRMWKGKFGFSRRWKLVSWYGHNANNIREGYTIFLRTNCPSGEFVLGREEVNEGGGGGNEEFPRPTD